MPLVGGHRYFTSTAVFLNEVLKLAVSIGMALSETSEAMPGSPLTKLLPALSKAVFTSDSWKLAIPAGLYTFQNTLQYVAVSNLDAATFQVTYQLKILTTALFSVTMLNRSLSVKKWISLVLLMAGVAVVQLPSPGDSSSTSSKQNHARDAAEPQGGNASIGLVAVIIACAISGLAGVYFEKVLKDSNSNSSLWVRNVQLSFYSLFPAFFVGVLFKDGADIARDGFFAGYNWVVWLAITFQAFGGLVVALVVNYADNIAKNFATSISIILSLLASVWLFDFVITVNFLLGMLVVLYATYLYSSPDRKPDPIQTAVNREERGEPEENTAFIGVSSESPLSPTLRSPKKEDRD
ncbi:nucleotide-sugar transporter [Rhizodiscina lignyota]|uniref:Nucleotide-sugar transporter n=1 Tax=Rhizodiscina lignyota TaxID=1504668 RepID=A0A9P4IQ67_9PEZI|nr:nucleotide-sugar transporter [Rhizodiscina lignyota]